MFNFEIEHNDLNSLIKALKDRKPLFRAVGKFVVRQAKDNARKIIKNRGAFPTDEAIIKILYLALRNVSKRWTMPIKNWKAALNMFAVKFEERFPG